MILSDIILIAIGLAMDCFAVSIACGIAMKPFKWVPAIRIALLFGLFQAIMPVDWVVGWQHLQTLDRIVRSLGGIRQSCSCWAVGCCGNTFFVHPDKKILNPFKKRVAVTLALATSIDALAIGLSFAFLHIDLVMPVSIIGAASLIFCFTRPFHRQSLWTSLQHSG